jgi:hydroxybutyrate-dimer hydrolase
MAPLTLYPLRALDLMWDHLTKGAPLPESQVLRTTPRGGDAGHAPPLEAANVPSPSRSSRTRRTHQCGARTPDYP